MSAPIEDQPQSVESDSTPITDSVPPTSPSLTTAASATSYIDLDTSTAQHVPHEITLEERTAANLADAALPSSPKTPLSPNRQPAAASNDPALSELDEVDSEPVSELDDVDEEDPIVHQQRMDAFIAALQQSNGIQLSSSDTDAGGMFSETEHSGIPNTRTPSNTVADPAEAAMADIQSFINRQQEAAYARRAAAAAAAAQDSGASTAGGSSSSAAADKAAKKAAFRRAVEERQRELNQGRGQVEEEEEEDIEEFQTPGAAHARNVQMREDEEEEEEEEEATSFLGFVKSYASSALKSKFANKVRSGTRWTISSGISYGLGIGYFVGTLALLYIPYAVAETNAQHQLARAQRLEAAKIPDHVKMEIWTGIPAQSGSADAGLGLGSDLSIA